MKIKTYHPIDKSLFLIKEVSDDFVTKQDLIEKISELENRISLLERGLKQDDQGVIFKVDKFGN